MDDPATNLAAIHAQALGYPEAYEELPWGHPAIKVRKKVFLFCSALGTDQPQMSVKLTASRDRALAHESVEPMGYGLGRHGWCTFSDLAAVPLDDLLDYVDESYRAVAPKTLLRQLGDARPPPATVAAAPSSDDDLPRVLVVGAGPRRRDRAIQGLVAEGCPAAGAPLDEALDVAGDLQPEAIVVDVGRESGTALERLVDLTALCPDARVVVAGIKAGVGTPEGTTGTAEPPGDPSTVRLVLGLLDG
ncbi:MAG: MmcQ/YjbR family DNA-binding protein [Myxococcota bacterium]